MTEILITSSVLILALLLLRKLFQKGLSRRVQYALWGLVLLRLLIPVNLPAIDFSVLNAAKPMEEAVTRTVVERPIYVPVAQAPLEKQPAAIETVPERTNTAVGESVWIARTERQTAVQYKRISARTILFWAWFAGCCAATVFLLLTNLRFWLRLRKVRKPYEVESCKLPVYMVETGLPAPCLFGLLHPAIYLTPGAVETPESLRHVLAHETTHARHLDHVWTFLRSVCLALYWFDPLVWAAVAAAKADCELACDEGALARLNDADRIPYGETLLSLLVVEKAENPMLAATTMTIGKKYLKERITRIAHKPRQFTAAVVAVAVLTLAISACTFTGGNSGGEKNLNLVSDLGALMLAGENLSADAQTKAVVGLGEQSEKILICVDKNFQSAAENLLSYYKLALKASAPEIQFQWIPAEKSEREIFITKTRLELMSGGGPDAFLLSSGDCTLNEREVLFSSPESAMHSRLFYPLDDFIANADFFQKDQLNPQVLAVGRTDEGQMLLPLMYTYPVAWVAQSETKKVNSLDWKEIVSGKSKRLKMAVERASGYPIGFTFLFPELADWERDNLLISRAELTEKVEEKRSLEPLWSESAPSTVGAGLLSYRLFENAPQKKELAYLPLTGEDGSITAAVTLFAAINVNTSPQKAKAAFSLFDFMLSDELVSGQGVYWKTIESVHEGEMKVYQGQQFYSFEIYTSRVVNYVFPIVNGISVKDQGEFLEGSFSPKRTGSVEAVREFRDRIGQARFYSNVDAALNEMMRVAYGSKKSSETIADEMYDTMLMILAEA